MFNWLTKLFGSKKVKDDSFAAANEARERFLAKAVAQAHIEESGAEPKARARDSKGRWLADNPETKANEAYEDSQK